MRKVFLVMLSTFNYRIRKMALAISRNFIGFGKSEIVRRQVLIAAWFWGNAINEHSN
jgi:hypothetical protein